MGEYGIVLPKGIPKLRRRLPWVLEDAEYGLTDRFRRLLADAWEHFRVQESQAEAVVASLPGTAALVSGRRGRYAAVVDGNDRPDLGTIIQ